MYYYGLRSSQPYLRSLDEIRALTEPHHITSVIGGFAVLHGISAQTQSITLVDTDSDAIDHWELMKQLVSNADSLEEFRFFLSGVADRARVQSFLPADIFKLYQKTYGSLILDPMTGTGSIGDSTIIFTDFDLKPMSFCWHFGKYNFSNNESFAAVQDVIRNRPITVIHGELQALDFSTLCMGSDRHIVLASNCESPLFTKQDVIYERVRATSAVATRYVSWIRDSWIADSYFAKPDTVPLSVAAINDCWVVEGPKKIPLSMREKWVITEQLPDLQAVRELVVYGRELLVVAGGDTHGVFSLLSDVAPAFKRVLWIDCASGADVLPPALVPHYWSAQVEGQPHSRLYELHGLRN